MNNQNQENLFLRNATGLVRSWSVFDAFVYAFFSINLITLGLYIFSFAPFIPEGNLMVAIVISGVFILFEVIVYSMLISVMPRAGGDYVWTSRVLGGTLGFILSMTGWVFILWHWVPVYGNILVWEVLSPLLVVLGGIFNAPGLINAGVWFDGTHGLFIGSMVVIALAFLFVSLGMKVYARIQKYCFWIGIAGLLTVFLLLLFNDRSSFINMFNSQVNSLFGLEGNVYQGIMEASASTGYTPIEWSNMPIMASLPLIPMVVFFNLWPNWGATLYGEVQGASEYKRNFWGMASAVIVTTILAVIMLGLFTSSFGWDFFHASSNAYWMGNSPLPVFPYPGLLAALLTENPLLQLWIIISLSAWFIGWVGTVFLSSTRVLFAAAFDRMLPEWVADINPRTRSPLNALLIMTVPAIIISILYSYTPNFATFTLDTTVVLAITFVGTTIAAIVLPWKRPEIYNSSPIARYKILGIPAITIAGVIFLAFLGYNLYMWIVDAVYGVNNAQSAIYMGVMFLLAIGIYIWQRSARSKEGVDVDMIYKNIPVE